MTEKEVIEEIYKYIPYEECRKMAEVINNSRSVIILSNSFLFNIANIMRESISSSNRKVYLVERSNNELIKTILRQVDCVFILTLTGQWINSCQYINNVSEKSQLCLISGSVPAILNNKPAHSIELNETVEDDYRIAFFRDHIRSVGEAIADGVEVLGYYMWSPLDIISCSSNQMSKRYGLVYVNLDDLGRGDGRRFCKKSYYWYQKLIATNGKSLEE